jgi:Tfp pilus assembly pilus retraction ATPase PilT
MCNFDSACMDCSCPFSHTSRRQSCLRLDACPIRLCPWIHPHRGFSARLSEYQEVLVASSPSLELMSVHAKTTLKVAKRLKKARDTAMAAFAETSDRRMMAIDRVEVDIEKAKCVEIIEQIESFDAFVAIPFEELVQHSAKPETGGVVKELLRRIDRELYRLECSPKPALTRRLEIMKFLSNDEHDSLVVRGATGSGKSTQLPQYIAELVIERNAQNRQAALTKGLVA